MFRLPTDVSDALKRGVTLVVPTPQRSHAVRLAHAAAELAAARRVWASADVLTPSAWARRECERRAADAPAEWPRILAPAEEWLLWRQVAHEAARDAPLLDTGLLAESLQRASERAAEYGVALHRGTPGSEMSLLHEAQRLFEARCRELGAASVSALASRLREAPGGRPLLLRGFDAVPRRLAALAAPGAAAAAATLPRGVRTGDAESQLEAIAAWCGERLAAQPDARLLVMLPGTPGTRERLAALVSAALDPGAVFGRAGTGSSPVGIEGGEPFGSLALPAQALLSLAVLARDAIEIGQLCRWLIAPYWDSPGPSPRAALAQLLRQRLSARMDLREFLGVLQLAPRELTSAARELDARIRRAEGLLGEGSASPRRWAERFEGALGALGWPGPLPPESALQQTRLRWRELLEQFGELAASTGSLSLGGARELLRALALRTAYRPADEGLPVTISPMLADPVVVYDGIWVGSLSADVLPLPVAPDPFLALRAQLEAGVPEASAAGRRAQAQALLAAWRRGAAELVLSVPAREQDLELLPSPCLAGTPLRDEKAAGLWLPKRLHRDGCVEALTDDTGERFNALTPLPSGTRALTLQNACAFRAYGELRLGATPPEEPEPGVPMSERGVLLHAALQMLWQRLGSSQGLAALDAPALDALIGECVTRSAQAVPLASRGHRRRVSPVSAGQFELFGALSPALERECRRAHALIRSLCELERTRAPFTVEATEHATELRLGGGRVRMRLDRVDRIAAGRAVLDYKSGRPGAPDWYGERPTHPQLLAYAAALGADVAALATVNLTAREVRFTGVAAAGDLLPRVKALAGGPGALADWGTQLGRWRTLLERLVRAFLAGDARVDPAPGACDYCHLTDLCRIGAHRSPEPPTHADTSDE
ncbi:MAG TPA: PD-(D/E)XK nuclease family protein [Steroidobacteraceae bacterium]|nr:PD-(D/E)XK nuclease family protein [Steroidobacteraceae bacterium]